MAFGAQTSFAQQSELLIENFVKFFHGATLAEHVPVGACGLCGFLLVILGAFAHKVGRVTTASFPRWGRCGFCRKRNFEIMAVGAHVFHGVAICEDDAFFRFHRLCANLHAAKRTICHDSSWESWGLVEFS